MNLAWLCAVLQPRDVAPHPNFSDDIYDSTPTAGLAALVLGDWNRLSARRDGAKINPWLQLVSDCLDDSSIASGVPALALSLATDGPTDEAQYSALTLVLACSAAELDDYETALGAIDRALSRVKDHGADALLVRAALLQQKALRLRDSGQEFVSISTDAARSVAAARTEQCSEFLTSPGVSWNSNTTIDQIRVNLIDAAGSLVPFDGHDEAMDVPVPTWQDRVRQGPTSLTTSANQLRTEVYSAFVAQQFRLKYAGRRDVQGWADLFYCLLRYELLGHGGVYGARKELALLRMIRDSGNAANVADAIRLLRHAGARTELELVLRRVQSEGPLGVLGSDSRQILRNRAMSGMLRSVELNVLRMSAELLAAPEAREALDLVLSCMAAGGPPDVPGERQMGLLRREAAWLAAAALANSCDAEDEVAATLLAEAQREPVDTPMLDISLRKAITELDWKSVGSQSADAWLSFLTSRRGDLEATGEFLFRTLGHIVPALIEPTVVDQVVHQLNRALFEGEVEESLLEAGPSLVRTGMEADRESAHRGSWSYGGPSFGDIAAGLITVGGVEDLWPDLSTYLLDHKVSRADRSPAFERLARSEVPVPPAIATDFHANGEALLASADVTPFQESIVPYPQALRFLASKSLVSDEVVFRSVGVLAALEHPVGRREAAHTVALLAARSGGDDSLLALAIPLSRDPDVEVRAHAARALALLGGLPSVLGTVATSRLLELLGDDGLLAPRYVLSELTDLSAPLQPEVLAKVRDLANDHPSRKVRQRAGRLLQSSAS